MVEGLGFGRRRLIDKIVMANWNEKKPELKNFSYNDLLFVIQEMFTEEGKAYHEMKTGDKRGHKIFRHFVKHLLYRNLANYDSMILLTSEKGCITGDALLEMPRNLKKYPKGIPLKDLEGKGPQWVYSFNRETKKLEVKKCDGVEFVKEDDVYEVELTNGQKIKATNDHPFLLTDGTYKQLKDLIWMDYMRKDGTHQHSRFMEKGKLIFTDRLRVMFRPDKPNLDNYIKFDYSSIKWKEGDNSHKHSIMEHRLIAESIFGQLKEKNIVHHKDKNRQNNEPNNLEILDSQSDHFDKHGMRKYLFKKGNKFCCNTGYSTKKKEKIKPQSKEFSKLISEKRIAYFKNPNNKESIQKFSEKRKKINPIRSKCQTGGIIKSVKYIGKQKVYDVVNVSDNHNFIVNGFVVSNTGKSSAAIMLAKAWCKLLGITFDPKRHIAYNNSDVMNKIDNLNQFEPIIADEAIRFACVVGWTKIKTPKGEIEIKDLEGKQNFEVYSFNEKTQKEEIQIAEKCIKVKNDIVYELELENGNKIQATKEHKFLTNNGWKMLSELNEGDDLTNKKIKSIKKIGIKPVYDIINVRKNNNYIANECVAHNSSADWAKKENKELKKKLAQVRTKHLLYILCFPLKINKLEKTYLESFVNYWCLSGDSIVNIFIDDKYKKIQLKELVKIKKSFKIQSYNIKNKKIEYKNNNGCILTKQKAKVYEIELEDGNKIKSTKEHKFLTKKGWKKLIDLTEDDVIACK